MFHTRVCDLFQIEKPIVNAPMGGVAGGELAAAVSEAGGLGLIGAMGNSADWLREQIALVRERTRRPFGVGFITHWLSEAPELYEVALHERVPVIAHSFDDPSPYAPAAIETGAKVICQVQSVEGAIRAAQAKADVIVAQGREAGGHTGQMSLVALLPQVVKAVARSPVIAAGGIADGGGLAAALILGAEGAWIGTAFLASPESLYTAARKRLILEITGSDTIHTRVFDIAMGNPWPDYIAGRAVRNKFTDRWHGKEDLLRASLDEAAAEMSAAVAADDVTKRPVWAGEGVGLVSTTQGAGDIVRAIAAEAEIILNRRYAQIFGASSTCLNSPA